MQAERSMKLRGLQHARTPCAAACLRSQRWLASKSLLVLLIIVVCVVCLGWTIARRPAWLSRFSASAAAADDIDQRLQRAATNALGNRRGTVIVMDPQTGRIQRRSQLRNSPLRRACRPAQPLSRSPHWRRCARV